MTWKLLAALLSLSLLVPATASAEVDAGRARRNYMELSTGEKQISQLTPIERQELALWMEAVRQGKEKAPDTRANCRARNGSPNPSDLEAAVIDLKCSQRR